MRNKNKKRSNKKKKTIEDQIYLLIVYTFLFIFVALVSYPLIYVLSCSISSPKDLVAGKVFFLPVNPGLQGYKAVFLDTRVWQGYFNTFVYTTVGTLIAVTVTMLGAFVLSRKEFPMRKLLTIFFTFTMFFGGGTIPVYLLLKQLHMLNTIWSIVLPGAFSVWMAIVGRTFIQSNIPEELFEATSLDGGDYFSFFVRIVLPLSKPILAVMALNFAVGHWNSYYSALLYLKDADKYPLQMVLRGILMSNSADITSMTSVKTLMEKQYLSELLKYSLIVVSSVPLIAIYPFIQKYFIKGVMVGSIKG